MTAFAGIRVLDLSRVLAGPFCGQMLADFGADVIKVEDVGGDENRKWAPVIDGQSANFLSVNRGKRGMTLNLKSESGQEVLADLVRKADVVIDSFLPGVARRLGVDDARLRALRPDLVHATISGYGHEGPLAAKPGYDLMLQAFSGMMAMTGERDGGPIRAGASFIDMATGLLAFSGIASALYARQAGRAGGQHIQVSLLETAIALLGYHVPAYTMGGKVPPRDGSGVWHIVPYQAFATRDGHVLAG
ncbi:MAG: CoA transferase, partial [Reyranella sp.]